MEKPFDSKPMEKDLRASTVIDIEIKKLEASGKKDIVLIKFLKKKLSEINTIFPNNRRKLNTALDNLLLQHGEMLPNEIKTDADKQS